MTHNEEREYGDLPEKESLKNRNLIEKTCLSSRWLTKSLNRSVGRVGTGTVSCKSYDLQIGPMVRRRTPLKRLCETQHD